MVAKYRQTAKAYAAEQQLTKLIEQINPSCGAKKSSFAGGISHCRYYGYYAVVSAKIFGRSTEQLFRKYYGIVCATKNEGGLIIWRNAELTAKEA